jgi:hypothetical protein
MDERGISALNSQRGRDSLHDPAPLRESNTNVLRFTLLHNEAGRDPEKQLVYSSTVVRPPMRNRDHGKPPLKLFSERSTTCSELAFTNAPSSLPSIMFTDTFNMTRLAMFVTPTGSAPLMKLFDTINDCSRWQLDMELGIVEVK